MKKKTKKTSKSRSKSKKLNAVQAMPIDKHVRIKKISNGYTLEQYTDKGYKEFYVEDLTNIASAVKKLME